MEEQNPVNELITIQRQNQELLKQLVVDQALLLEYEKNRQKKEKHRFIGTIIKYLFWIIIIIWSLSFTQKLMNNMLGGMTGGGNLDISNLLEGVMGGGGIDSGVRAEIEKYLGK